MRNKPGYNAASNRGNGLRVVLFGSGGTMPETVLRSLVRRHEVLAIVLRGTTIKFRAWLRSAAEAVGARKPDPFLRAARELRIPILRCTGRNDSVAAQSLRRLRSDVLVISSFPCLLGEEIIQSARFGAINMHTSLLPRHRGPLPMFWVYHEDDRQTGVTVHRATRRADAGDIFAQASFDVPRGYPIQQLHDRSSMEGARLIEEVLSSLEKSTLKGVPQDDNTATKAPRVPPGSSMVDFDHWPVERVWHFLTGMYPHFIEPMRTLDGHVLRYSGVGEWEEHPHDERSGSVRKDDQSGWRLYCRGGSVRLLS